MEWILGICSLILLLLSLVHLYRKYRILTSYKLEIGTSYPSIDFSIVLCTEGPATKLLSYLDKILEQNYSCFELLIICKNTPLDILEILHQKAMNISRLHIENITALSRPYSEKKQALNYGISLAKHDWIVTIDDDCYPASDDWLASISQHIQHLQADIILGLSPYISQSGLLNQWIRYDALQTAINLAYYTIIGKPYMGIGRNMAFKKDLWSQEYLGEYGTLGSGDDTTLVSYYKGTKKIDVLLDSLVYSFPHTSFTAWLRQKLRHIHKGKFLDRSIQIELVKPLLFNFLFWFCIWLWISFFAFHFFIFLFVFSNIMSKTFFYYMIAKHFKWKVKPCLYTFLFDAFHNFFLLVLPFFSIFIKNRWRNQ